MEWLWPGWRKPVVRLRHDPLMSHESLGTVRHLAACPTPDTFLQNGIFVMITIQEKIGDSSPTEQLAQTWHPEAELIRDYGRNSLAFFGLAPVNRHFLAPDGAGLVNYRLVGNVAVVVGDPVCPPEACEQVTQSFLDFCARQKWRVAFYQASPHHLITFRALNLHAFKMGEEALLHPQTFTLRGSALANVRTSSRRAERDGVIIHWYDGVPPSEVMQQLEHVSSAWLEHKAGEHAAETGFSTGRLDELMKSAERADAIAHLSVPPHSSLRAVPRFVTGVATTSAGT